MSVRQLFARLFLLSLPLIAITEAMDPDMWWHLRTGEAILQDGIPRQDIFSFTALDYEWVTHEWLSQVVMWLVYQAAGFGGLIFFFALVVALTFWLVYQRCVGRPYLAAFVTLLAALAASLIWGVRPQLFNYLFLAAFVFIVEGYKERQARGGERELLWLPILTILWANLHSGYLLGVVLLATYTVGEAGQRWLGQPDPRGLEWRGIRWLAAMTVACLIAALLNVNGVELWIYPFLTLGSDVMQSRLTEWLSPDFHNPYNWPFGALLIVGGLSWAVRRERPALTDLLLFGGTAVAGLVSMRHIPIFAVVAAPIICRNLLSGLEGTRFYGLLAGTEPDAAPKPFFTVMGWVLVGALLVGIGGRMVVALERTEQVVRQRFPVEAVDWLEREGLADARGFNSYNWGGYLIWRGVPVFVDGRADVYGDPFLRDYFTTYSPTESWRDVLDEYDVQYTLSERGGRLAIVLAASGEWREVYRDDVAVIFVPAESETGTTRDGE